MTSKLALPKGKTVKKPLREPDMLSKRSVPYWFGPEWVRGDGTIGRIIALKNATGGVDLHAVSKEGSIAYIQGSIQGEFHTWHIDRQIDAILLGIDEDEIISAAWDYK